MKILYALALCLYITAHAQDDGTNPIAITIWVHGTRIGPSFFLHDFFYRRLGIVNALDYAPRYHAQHMARYFCQADPQAYQLENFYFWGWSGKLSRTARKNEARTLYQDILTLKQTYAQKYPNRPLYVRLISHSHGGNVLLNLSQVQNPDSPLDIDELILLSCPVQYATKEYVKSPCFKKIYSFYSSDLYQVIDWQRVCKNGSSYVKMRSNRRFEEVPNLRQAKLKIDGRFLFHIEFLCKRFVKHIPRLCQELDALYQSHSQDMCKREKLLHVHNHEDRTVIGSKLFKR